MMIVVPIKMNNPQLFPSCEDPQIVLGSVNDSVMCKSLVHYSMMTKSASIGVLNSIFYVSNLIVAKIVGCCVPIFAKAIHIDPAVFANPFITTITDVLSLLIFCGVTIGLFGLVEPLV